MRSNRALTQNPPHDMGSPNHLSPSQAVVVVVVDDEVVVDAIQPSPHPRCPHMTLIRQTFSPSQTVVDNVRDDDVVVDAPNQALTRESPA